MAAIDEDSVFRALADPTRRALLDALFEADGQSVSMLEARLPMSRFGVAKHLRVLASAGLVTVQQRGRERRHYLNPVPIRVVHDRWVSRYAAPFAGGLVDLKQTLEGAMSPFPNHVHEVFIRTTPERLWRALVDPDQTERYYFGTRLETTLEPGAPYAMRMADGSAHHDGTIVEAVPGESLVMTFRWHCEGPETRVSFLIEAQGELCRLTLVHEGLDPEAELSGVLRSGWARILSGLKTLLETGEPMAAA